MRFKSTDFITMNTAQNFDSAKRCFCYLQSRKDKVESNISTWLMLDKSQEILFHCY